MEIIILLIMWTCGLTPLWANIAATIYIVFAATLKFTLAILKANND